LRPANKEDIPKIVELAVESVQQLDWPVMICRPKMKENIKDCMESGFVWVSDIDGVKGAVVALRHPSYWFVGDQVSIGMFYCKTGEGYKLLKKFSDWLRSEENIKSATVILEEFMDDKYIRMFNRLGFTRKSSSLLYVRNT
jgi:hypothetical protein